MASRRRSVLPVSKTEAPTMSSATSRRTSLGGPMKPPTGLAGVRGRPAGSKKPEVEDVKNKAAFKAPSRATTTKRVAAASKVAKKTNDFDEFVSGETFDFKMADSPVGPMTRARRSSISHLPAPLVVAGKASAKKTIAKMEVLSEEVSSPKLKTPKPLAMLNEEEESSPPKEVKSSARVSRSSRTQETKTPVKMETKTPKKSQQIATPAKAKTPATSTPTDASARRPFRTPATRGATVSTPNTSLTKKMKRTPILRLTKIVSPVTSPLAKSDAPTPAASRLTSSTKKKTPAKTPAKTSPVTKPRPQLETVAEEKVVQEPAVRSIRKPVFRPKVLTENNAANQQLPLSSITNKMPFTPQAADPSKLLRKNLRLKVETQIDKRVHNLPNGSPYTLMQGVTENGSPAEVLMKLNVRPNRSSAATFVTGTPAPTKRQKVVSTVDKENVDDITDSGPAKPIKRKLSMSLDDDEENMENVENAPKKFKATEDNDTSLVGNSGNQLVTGALDKICTIM